MMLGGDKMKKVASIGIFPFVSVVAALYLYLYFFKGWMVFYLHHVMETIRGIDYIVIGLTALFIYLIGIQLIEWKFSKKLTIIIYVLYFACLIFLLFGKASHVQGASFQTFDFILPFLEGNLRVITLGNIILFMPIGFLFYPLRFIPALVLALCLIFTVEGLQFIFSLGYFDTGDIFLNVLGIMLGYLLIQMNLVIFKHTHLVKSQ